MTANIQVSIPVRRQGTGFRGEREDWTNPHVVSMDDADTVTLARSPSGERISFKLADLNEAIAFVKNQKGQTRTYGPFDR